ncbi:DUF3017 domain-containing protein [Actinomyces wuliandei]|uniref:DUF3017 domain-containing protein n=1 Tax=Actinomyces wuliandei TaxID=2057743 RepID=UPI000FD9CDEC|nr:DUF3017 domain-containing protein [Actinomyces wuliandei]
MAQQEHLRQAGRKEPYSTVGVVLVALGLAAVPVLTLLGQRLLAVLWLAVGLLVLALVRLRRPEGSWLAARGRVFDVAFGTILAGALLALAQYVNLPRLL